MERQQTFQVLRYIGKVSYGNKNLSEDLPSVRFTWASYVHGPRIS